MSLGNFLHKLSHMSSVWTIQLSVARQMKNSLTPLSLRFGYILSRELMLKMMCLLFHDPTVGQEWHIFSSTPEEKAIPVLSFASDSRRPTHKLDDTSCQFDDLLNLIPWSTFFILFLRKSRKRRIVVHSGRVTAPSWCRGNAPLHIHKHRSRLLWELLKRRYTIANSTIHIHLEFSFVIVLHSSTLGFHKFEIPTNFQKHLSAH
jgi:hypothetical protein